MSIYSKTDFYEVLEVSPEANKIEIKSAYRKLVRKYHPDLNSGDIASIEKFKLIAEAYEILSDKEKKKNYDILRGHKYKRYSSNEQSAQKKAKKAYEEKKKEFTSDKDLSDSFGKIFSDIFDGLKQAENKAESKENEKSENLRKKAQETTKQLKPEKGKDVYSDVTITLEESINGTTRTINVLHSEICAKCAGRKFLNGGKCCECGGLGEKTLHKKIAVKIPAGIKEGSKIRLANEGNKGYNGGKNGDLYLKIKIKITSKFNFDGNNVLSTVSITPYQAALGGNIIVETINGTANMKVIEQTCSGQKFRLAGQGLKDKNGNIGDMIVTVNIEVSKNLTEEETKLYEKLRDVANKKNRKGTEL